VFLSAKKPVEAKLVGNTLVAVFRASDPGLIWKFDLERNHSFTLALQGEEGDLELGVTSPKGEFYPIARFGAQEDADEAFAAVQKILMRGKRGRLKTVFAWFGGFIALAIVVLIAGHYINYGISNMKSAAGISSGSETLPEGVPLPADQVLKQP
jgi:hypothetical protein